MKISFIFPAYNEAAALPQVLENFSRFCQAEDIDHELIVVNDGSTDATGHVARIFASTHPSVRLIEHDQNRGYGAALRTGFAAATGEYIFFTDGDGQFLPADLTQTLPRLAPNAMVLGVRQRRAEGFQRRLNSWLWTRVIRLSLGVNVQDLNCAWKIFPRHLVTACTLTANGAFINAELLFHARRIGLRVHEIPIHHWPRQSGRPTGANLRVILRAFQELAGFLRHQRTRRFVPAASWPSASPRESRN